MFSSALFFFILIELYFYPMKNFFSLLYALITLSLLPSCNSTAKIQDGETAYKYKKYSLSAEMLQKDFSKSKNIKEQSEIALKIADSYDKQLNFKAAEPWYEKIADARILDNAIMMYVNALKHNEKYAEAYKYLNDYLKANKSEKFHLQKEIDILNEIINPAKKSGTTKTTNLSINSSSADFAPFIKDNILYFTSNRGGNKTNLDEWTGQGYTGIYSAKRYDTTSFAEPLLLDKPINTSFHNAEFILTKDGKTSYFTRCGSDTKNVNDFCHIFKSTKNIDDTWSIPERIKLFADTINEGQPYLTPDENELYFVSDSKDGYGGRDIYFARKNIAGEFENPINAGSKVNTQGDELFPVITQDNTLYFSSNGRIGYGGLDIFSATKEGKIYTNVQNLGYGVNSGGDDFSIILIKSKDDSVLLNGYLTSNRPGGKGLDDIYYFEKRKAPKEPLPPAVYLLKIYVQSKTYQDENNPNSTYLGVKPMDDATIELPRFDKKTDGFQFLHTNKEGMEQLFIPKNSQFNIKVFKTGFLNSEEQVNANIPGADGDTIVIEKVVILSKIFKNVEITLNNIYYDYDKWNIRADAAQSLDTLVNILAKNPSIKIQLSSHTDCRGKDSYNETLSQKRAESVVQYLIQKGIAANRLTAKGYGEAMPIENCACEKCTEEQHQKNRRTTFKILSE